ncbi:MAG: hypothetical protein ACTSPV_11475 [Candidatus Hodarchaeales archaeon]
MVAPQVKRKKDWLLITTSRNPSHALRRAAKVLYYSFPGSKKINRGSMNFNSVLSFCWSNSIERILILNKTSSMGVFEVKAFKLEDKVISFGAKIEMTDVIDIKKHDSSTRIDIRGIRIVDKKETDSVLSRRVFDFFRPGQVYYQNNTRELQLRIESESSHYVSCSAVQQNITSELKLFLFTFKESFEES